MVGSTGLVGVLPRCGCVTCTQAAAAGVAGCAKPTKVRCPQGHRGCQHPRITLCSCCEEAAEPSPVSGPSGGKKKRLALVRTESAAAACECRCCCEEWCSIGTECTHPALAQPAVWEGKRAVELIKQQQYGHSRHGAAPVAGTHGVWQGCGPLHTGLHTAAAVRYSRTHPICVWCSLGNGQKERESVRPQVCVSACQWVLGGWL